MAQLTQPIFARGKLKANLKTTQLTQEDMQKKYVQTVIDAGTHEFMDNGKVSYIEVLTA